MSMYYINGKPFGNGYDAVKCVLELASRHIPVWIVRVKPESTDKRRIKSESAWIE